MFTIYLVVVPDLFNTAYGYVEATQGGWAAFIFTTLFVLSHIQTAHNLASRYEILQKDIDRLKELHVKINNYLAEKNQEKKDKLLETIKKKSLEKQKEVIKVLTSSQGKNEKSNKNNRLEEKRKEENKNSDENGGLRGNESVQQTVSMITSIQQLLKRGVVEPLNNNRVKVVFPDTHSVKEFQRKLFKIGIENPGMKGELRKIKTLQEEGMEVSQERYAGSVKIRVKNTDKDHLNNAFTLVL